MIKRTPATPLPYIVGDMSHTLMHVDGKKVQSIAQPDCLRDYDCDKDKAHTDMTYLAHAANAYPKLVEFVQMSERSGAITAKAAQILLIELGEA